MAELLPAGTGAWAWVAPAGDLRFDPLGSLTFVRDTTPAAVVDAFGLEWDSASSRSAAETDPDIYEGPGDPGDLLRLATDGSWVAAVEPGGIRASTDGIADQLGRDCAEVLTISVVAIKGFASFGYFRAGTWVCGGLLGETTAGEDPQHFDAAFAAAGYPATEFAQLSLAGRVVLALTVFGRELGFALSADVYAGPMPTSVRRRVPAS